VFVDERKVLADRHSLILFEFIDVSIRASSSSYESRKKAGYRETTNGEEGRGRDAPPEIISLSTGLMEVTRGEHKVAFRNMDMSDGPWRMEDLEGQQMCPMLIRPARHAMGRRMIGGRP
jgi:hypothetical protein